MSNFEIQFFFNSGPAVFLVTRYADYFVSAEGRLKLVVFLMTSFVGNTVLMLDRFRPFEAMCRGAGNALILCAGVYGLAAYKAHRRRKQTAGR